MFDTLQRMTSANISKLELLEEYPLQGCIDVAFSPLGQLAAVYQDGVVIYQSLTDTSPIKVPLKPPMRNKSLAFHPDGTTLAVINGDFKIDLINPQTGERIVQIDEAADGILFSPDGQHFITNSLGVMLWETKAPTQRGKTMESAQYGYVCKPAFTPDGAYALVGRTRDNTVVVFDVAKATPQASWTGHTGQVYAVDVHPKEAQAASGSQDRTVRIWNIATGETITSLTEPSAEVRWVGYSPNGSVLIAATHSDDVLIWDATTYTHLHTIKAIMGSFVFHPNRRVLVSTNRYDHKISLWGIQA